MHHVEEPKYARHLEDVHIQTHAKSYPEKMREPFIWFATYVRESCRRNLDVLVAKMKELGFTTTAGTYAKLLQGRWAKDTKGNATPPIIALDKFIEQVNRLKENHRLSQIRGIIPFILTPTYHEISNYIDERRIPGAVCKFGVILGPTGAMKTASFQYKANNTEGGRFVHMESPDTPTMGKFYTDLSEKFGVARGASQNNKIERIHENVTPDTCLIIDNIQRMHKEGKGWTQPVFSFLQRLQDERGCTIIFGGVLGFKNQLLHGSSHDFFEQFEGRAGGRDEFLMLPSYATQDDLEAIAEGVGLRPTRDTLKLMGLLSKKPGRIRILFNKLQKAIQLAENNKEKLELKHLRIVSNQQDDITEESI